MDIKQKIRALSETTGLFVTREMNVYTDDTSNRRKIYDASTVQELYHYLLMFQREEEDSGFTFHTEPYEHQKKAFSSSKDRPNYALFMEMGTGKTKVTLDTAVYLYKKRKIDSVVIFAPNGVHRNWMKEIDVHVSPAIKKTCVYWSGSFTKKKKTAFFDTLNDHTGLLFASFNIDSARVKAVREKMTEHLINNKTLLIIDESTRIKNIKAQRTKHLIAFGNLAKYKRILTGTPITQNPLDLFGQFSFLDPTVFGGSYYAFRARYAVMENQLLYFQLTKFMDRVSARTIYDKLSSGKFISNHDLHITAGSSAGAARNAINRNPLQVATYKNLPEMTTRIKPHSFRVLKTECLDLPEKIYVSEVVDLPDEIKRQYDRLNEELFLELDGAEVTVSHVLTKLLRLQQITGGFLKIDEGEYHQIDNTKIDRVVSIVADLPVDNSIIIWARFIHEIKALQKALADYDVSVYHGEVSQEDRHQIIDDFQNSQGRKILIGNAATAGLGLTLTASNTVIYYSNSFSLEERLQSEDRAHRIGQKSNVTYIDLVASDTIDEKINASLRDKIKLADLVTTGLRSFLNI